MYGFLKTYDSGEKFNEDFIFMRRQDNILEYVNDICKALEVVEGIEYLGGELITDESTFKTRRDKDMRWISLEESRLNLIRIKFRVSHKDKSDEIKKEIYFPKLINDFYFILNGSKYYPIYQLIDASTYKTPKSLTLKTLLMPIVLRDERREIQNEDGKTYLGRVFELDLFKFKVNFLLYFFAKMGFYEALEFMGFGQDCIGLLGEDEELAEGGYEIFPISRHASLYAKSDLLSNQYFVDIVTSVLQLFSTRASNIEGVENPEYWKKRLGAVFTKNTNSQDEKAEKILISFERILDSRTKKVLRIDPSDKESVYAIVRWMIREYDELSRNDNMDLLNKRLRVNEYLIHPLLMKFSTATYRLLNSRTVTLSNLKEIFNISPGFVIRRLITNELLRYSSTVNGIDLFSSALRFSQKGPQSLAEGGRSVAIRYRGLHPSYIGRVGLNAASASDPGMVGTFTPFVKTDKDGFFFSEEQ